MHRFQSLRERIPSSARRLSLIGLTAVLVGIQLLTTAVALPKHAAAAVPPSEYKPMEMSALVLKCAQDEGLATTLIGDHIGDHWIFGSGKSDSSVTAKDANERKYHVSALVQKDGTMQCNSAVSMSFSTAGIDYESEYIDKFFERDPDSDEGLYKLKSQYDESDLLNFIKKAFEDKGWTGPRTIPYVNQVLKPLFSQCIVSIDKYKYDENNEHMFEYKGKYYELKGGKGQGDSKTDKNVGLIIDPPDGIWSCGEFINKMKVGGAFAENKTLKEILLGGAAQEAEEEQNAQAKKDAIKKVFTDDPTKLMNCVAAVSPGLYSTGQSYVISIITDWLANGGTGAITYSSRGTQGGGNTTTIPEDQAKVLGKCLTDEYGAVLAEAIATEVDFSPPGEGEEGGDSCYDSIEPLFTIPLTNVKIPNPFKWAVCGIAQMFAGLIDAATNVVQDLLKFNPTSDEDGGESLHEVWKQILTVANILFVIAFLVMVISTVLDLGFFSNYTVKKLLPKIIIGAILANISWDICRLLIETTNLIGGAVREVILAPLNAVGALKCASTDPGQCLQAQAGAIIGENGTVATVAIGALIYASIASAGAILLPVLTTVGLAAAIAVVVLLLRRVIIILLIVAAPLAFVLMALPGGENLTKRWWKTFIQMLLMYPMIMALFASGIFISSLLNFSVNDDLISQGIQAIVLFLPFFMLPFLFKAAGGALANVSGMINDRSKGLVDRSKNWRDKNSQYGRRKELKAQRKNFTGHEKLLKSMDADSLALGDNKAGQWLQRRRRSQGLGRNWGQGHEAKETQRNFLAKMEAAVSKEQMESAAYLARAAGGGIDAMNKDGSTKRFKVTRAGEKEAMWLGKDAAIAEAMKGAKVEAMKEDYSSGKLKYTNESEGTLFDGSKAAQRAAGALAGSQALTPVLDAVRLGDKIDPATGKTRNGWKRYNNEGEVLKDAAGNDVYHSVSSFSEQFSSSQAGSAANEGARVASGVIAEVKEGYASNLSGKMPSFIKGESLSFDGIQAESLSNFHENEVGRLVQYATGNSPSGATPAPEIWSRIGQSMKQIVEDPAKYNMSPKALAELKRGYNDHIAGGGSTDPVLDKYMAQVNADGTLQHVTVPKTII